MRRLEFHLSKVIIISIHLVNGLICYLGKGINLSLLIFRLRNCTMLTVSSGDCVMVPVKWWQPLTRPVAVKRPERV